jgi:NitT/TauT family transport system substrate-binding protein
MIGGSKDVTLIYLEALAKQAGLKAGDFNLVYAGATSARFAALSAGGVDATILLSPFDFAAASAGYSDLGSIHKVLPGFPFSAWGVNVSWAEANRATLVNFLKAYQQGVDWLYDPKNKAQAIDILVKASGAKPDDIARTYDSWIGDIRVFPKDGAMPKEGFDRMLAAIVQLGDLAAPPPPMSKFVDDSYLKAAMSAK